MHTPFLKVATFGNATRSRGTQCLFIPRKRARCSLHRGGSQRGRRRPRSQGVHGRSWPWGCGVTGSQSHKVANSFSQIPKITLPDVIPGRQRLGVARNNTIVQLSVNHAIANECSLIFYTCRWPRAALEYRPVTPRYSARRPLPSPPSNGPFPLVDRCRTTHGTWGTTPPPPPVGADTEVRIALAIGRTGVLVGVQAQCGTRL